jgi:serine phosphatase RsbU (regulator of sigma subunit)/tetratricopeptide (TPR) repeat protein
MTKIFTYLILVLVFCFCQKTLFAQQNKIDSLLSVLKASKLEDTARINTLNALGEELRLNKPDTAIILSAEALQLAEKQNYQKGVDKSYHQLGEDYQLIDDYPKSLDNYFKALKIREERRDKQGIAKTLGNIGIVYIYIGDYPKALDYYFKALKIDTELGNKKGIARHLGNIGVVYMQQHDYPKALDYYFKGLEIDKELENKKGIATNLGNIGIIYFDQKDYPNALDYFFKGLKMDEELGDKNGIARQLGNIGSVYTSMKKYKEAENYLYRAITLDESIGALYLTIDVENSLSELYSQTNKFEMSLMHYKKYIIAKDSLFSQENKKKSIRTEMNFEFDKKEAVANAEHKSEMEKQNEVAEEKSRKQNIVIWSVIVGLLLLAVFAGFIFRSLRLTNKQKQIIEEKNHEITDSINYAQRIQLAILPPQEDISIHLSNYFILFKPKDIVSGDFYWFSKTENKILIAAADCTGHGVPGAFMSTIGSEKLNDAVINSEDVSVILQNVNIKMKKALRQSAKEDSTRDGMDIALCSFNNEMNLLEYAGANRPLWIIKNGKNEIEETKATKTAIGGLTKNDQIFTKHQTQLQKGDTVYISTDGFADQFSQQDKKLMTKKFKEILISIQDKSMEEQKLHLNNFIENWKGNLEQTDDILVIGLRI